MRVSRIASVRVTLFTVKYPSGSSRFSQSMDLTSS